MVRAANVAAGSAEQAELREAIMDAIGGASRSLVIEFSTETARSKIAEICLCSPTTLEGEIMHSAAVNTCHLRRRILMPAEHGKVAVAEQLNLNLRSATFLPQMWNITTITCSGF